MTNESGGSPESPDPISFDDLKAAAQKEDWETVDGQVESFCDQPDVIEWALGDGLKDEDGNLRDLAATLIQQSDCKLEEEDRTTLMERLENDENPYVKFRAAFALFAHGDRSEQTINKIQEAAQDEDVEEIARGYLSQLEE